MARNGGEGDFVTENVSIWKLWQSPDTEDGTEAVCSGRRHSLEYREQPALFDVGGFQDFINGISAVVEPGWDDMARLNVFQT